MMRHLKKTVMVCFAMLIALCMVQLFGIQEASAAGSSIGTVKIDLTAGSDFVMNDKMEALSNVFAALADADLIAVSGEEYDLDMDGNAEFTVNHDAKTEYNPEMDWYDLSDSTSFENNVWSMDVPARIKRSLWLRNRIYCDRIEISFPVLVREMELSLKAPVCGDETDTPRSEHGYWEWEKQSSRPEAEVLNSDSWMWINAIDSYWKSDENSIDPYIGVMRCGDSRRISIDIVVEDGYKVADGIEISADGFEIDSIDVSSLFTRVNGTVIVPDDRHTEGKPEIIPPTLENDGQKVWKCKGCGKVLRTEAISNAGYKEVYAKGESDGRAAAGKTAAERAAKFTPGRAVIKKVKAGDNKAKVTWKTMKDASSYRVSFTNTKTGVVTSVIVKQTKKLAGRKTIGRTVKLGKGKYKVRVRAYRKDSGETFRGPWSKAKTISI